MSHHRYTIPKFVPATIARNLLGQSVQIERLPAVIRRRLRTPEKISPSEHAAKFRVVTEDPHPGPWRNELSPHTQKIMDSYALPWVREIWYCGVDQSGKTNSMLCCMHWAADIDPGNIFYLMPTEATSDKVTSEKIIPMLRASKRLAKYVSKAENDTTLARINLTHGVTIRPAHANSAASMATFSAKHCFGDEVDKYPARTGQEADPISLIRRRNRQYRGRYKRFFSSTPAQQFIYQGTMQCRQVWEMRHRCPHCGQLFRPASDCLVLPENARASEIGPESGIAYCCTVCGGEISDAERWQLLGEPCWVCIKGEDIAKPSTVGFHHRAWDCRDVPLHEIAQAWLAAKQGGTVEQVAWLNGYEAEDYVYEHEQRREDALHALVDDRPEGLVPGGGVVQCLVAGSDTQDNGHYFWIDAVGWGLEQERWRIRAGFVETDAALLHVLFETMYSDPDGRQYPVALCVKDAMGHRTASVYEMCIRYPGRLVAYKGTGRRNAPRTETRVDRYPGTSIPIPGGVRLFVCDSHFFKDAVSSKLQISAHDPGAWHFDHGFTAEQASHLCCEYRDERGLWQCPTGKPNHYWDSMVMSMIASDILQCKFQQRPVEQAAEPQTNSSQPKTALSPARRSQHNPFTGRAGSARGVSTPNPYLRRF